MSQRSSIPGFYYDEEKNRYFPIKGRIPGSARSRTSSSSCSDQKAIIQPTREANSCRRNRIRTSKLLQDRELCGNFIASSKGRCNFNVEFQKTQVSCPVVWKYHETEKMGDGALEQIHLNVQTPEGQTETNVLLTGGKNGSLSVFEVGKVGRHFNYGTKCIPDRVWPNFGIKQEECDRTPGKLWRPTRTPIQMPSNVSSVKVFRTHCSHSTAGPDTPHALISTLGSETYGGSLCLLNLIEPLDFNSVLIRRRIQEVATFSCTIWTTDCGSNEHRAVIGTNLGSALVDLGTGMTSWVLRSKSDVFAQQFIHSGNVVLCGLRNGAIVTVDVREKPDGFSTRLVRHKIPKPSGKTIGKANNEWFKLSGDIYPFHTVSLTSSISCLVSLLYDDQYFLASSMDGTIKLYDHRLIQRGAVQSYEGHVNSHTQIQLGVDPHEKFVASGGEDCKLRLWSIKSGELLYENKFSNTIPSTVCWREAGRCIGAPAVEKYLHGERNNVGAWLGSEEGLFYMHWS